MYRANGTDNSLETNPRCPFLNARMSRHWSPLLLQQDGHGCVEATVSNSLSWVRITFMLMPRSVSAEFWSNIRKSWHQKVNGMIRFRYYYVPLILLFTVQKFMYRPNIKGVNASHPVVSHQSSLLMNAALLSILCDLSLAIGIFRMTVKIFQMQRLIIFHG